MSSSPEAYAVVIADLRRQRSEIDSLIAKLEAMAGASAAMGSKPTTTDVPQKRQSGAEPDGPYAGLTIVDGTIALLAERRVPLTTTEIVAALEAGGMQLTSRNKPNTVNTTLNRRSKRVGDVVRPERGKWGLSEWSQTTQSELEATPQEPRALLISASSASVLPSGLRSSAVHG